MNLLRKITAAVMLAVFAASISATTFVDQPFMQAALDDLRDAQNHLKNATADKGGHRKRAMDFTAGAITAVNKGIAYDRKNVTTAPDRLDANAVPDQPNMVKAREELQSALANLRKASADKGGFRNQAIAMTNNAINAVDAGLAYDRRN